jgi:hypothetical protein
MMYVKFLIVQNNLYINGLKDMKSWKKLKENEQKTMERVEVKPQPWALPNNYIK